jgi:hypothetical protein
MTVWELSWVIVVLNGSEVEETYLRN